MQPQEITNILLGLLAVGLPAATFLYASRANRIQASAEAAKAAIEEKGVDARAFDQAAKLYQDLIDSLRIQLDRVEASNRRLEESNTRLEGEVFTLRMEIAELKKNQV